MAHILVTGGAGYIGSTLVPMLLNAGHHVVVLDRFFFGRQSLDDDVALTVIRDDSRLLTESVFEGIDAVIDLAGVSNDNTGETFQKATWDINWQSRVRTARMAKAAGVRRYILPSSCSVYGFQPSGCVADETSPSNPLTTYAKANVKAERDVLPLGNDNFTVIALRQATVYGFSPRMRFDLAVNGMTYSAWTTGKLSIMGDGTQWRPMIHVSDVALAIMFMLDAPAERVSGQVFNVGSASDCYQIGALGEVVSRCVGRRVEIEWYGEPDRRSYNVDFQKIERLGYRTKLNVEDGVMEICAALEAKKIDRTADTITLEWYKNLAKWYEIVKEVELYGGMLDIPLERFVDTVPASDWDAAE
ncbi:MAG: NAD-dependent epimerase/dehydratase family protein [Rhizobiaceae bacterium]